jgi:hypothetical protein
MKKQLLLIIAAASFGSIKGQSFIKGDGGIGAAFTTGALKSYGISASAEPKFFFNPQISAGLRFEGNVLFGGSLDNSSGNFNVGLSSRAATLIKGEYYFSEKKNRVFVGLMAGRYTQANVGAGSSGNASISAGTYYGFAPELGVTFNNFRISAMYHFIPGTDLVKVSSGNPVEISRNYFVVQLGFKMFEFKTD